MRGWLIAGREQQVDLAAVREALERRRAELQQRLGVLTRPPERGAGLGFGKRVGDGTTEAVSRLTDVGVADSLQATEERVLRALSKLDEGSYGTCDACGEPIPAARLTAVPESVLCMACARRS